MTYWPARHACWGLADHPTGGGKNQVKHENKKKRHPFAESHQQWLLLGLWRDDPTSQPAVANPPTKPSTYRAARFPSRLAERIQKKDILRDSSAPAVGLFSTRTRMLQKRPVPMACESEAHEFKYKLSDNQRPCKWDDYERCLRFFKNHFFRLNPFVLLVDIVTLRWNLKPSIYDNI